MAEVKIGKKYELEKPQEETILYEKVEPHIARVILNRPEKHNAILTPEMFIELKNKMVMGVDDDDVKVIILKGNGPSFSSGDDQGRPPFEAYGGEPGVKPPQSVRITKMWQWVKAFNDATVYCPKIVIAQVQGWVIGMATQMVEACDLAIAGESLKYGHLEQRIGFAGMLPFPTLIHKLLTLGPKRTREQLLTSKVLTAQQALDCGLVNAVVPDDQLDEETLRWARALGRCSYNWCCRIWE
jgi:enoyl-CoA hydratase